MASDSTVVLKDGLPSNEDYWETKLSLPTNCDCEDVKMMNIVIEKHGIRIPRNGFYALCFGMKDDDFKLDYTKILRASSTSTLRSGKYSLCFLDENNSYTGKMLLPFLHRGDEKRENEIAEMISLEAGKVLKLKEGMKICVIQTKPDNQQETLNESDAKKEDIPLLWKLVGLRPKAVEPYEIPYDENTSDTSMGDKGNEKAEETIELPTNHREILVIDSHVSCPHCQKAFASVRGLLTHFKSKHHEIKDPLWTTPLKVIYEDDVLAVVDKPQGMTVMGGPQTLVRSDLLLPLRAKKTAKNRLGKPVPAHRLDAPTGGLLLLAKTKDVEIELKKCFANRTCVKRYRAIVAGKLEPKTGECHTPVSGKEASTTYSVVRSIPSAHSDYNGGWITIVDLFPFTGRKHQLRRHMKELGHFIIGDKKYGKQIPENEMYSKLCLWHMEITFPHPQTEKSCTVAMEKDPEWLTHVAASEGAKLKR